MLWINRAIQIPESELEFSAIRAQGSGGQNVNKVSSAVHLRFDIGASSLPEEYKQKLLDFADERISASGVIVIKAQRFRSQVKNREDACQRLRALLCEALQENKRRVATRLSQSVREKRKADKQRRSSIKSLRTKISTE